MAAEDRPPHGPCARDGACGCTACVQQTELEDTANQLRNLRLYIHQISAERDREEQEAGAPAERAPSKLAPADRPSTGSAPTGSAPAERATSERATAERAAAAANVGAACAGIAGACPGNQWRTLGAAPAARIYHDSSGHERGAAVVAAGLDPAELTPTWRDATPTTAEITPRVSLGVGAARGTATHRRLTGGEKLRSRIDDNDDHWAVSRGDTQLEDRFQFSTRTGAKFPTPAVPQGCVLSESSLRRGKHATTARFLQA